MGTENIINPPLVSVCVQTYQHAPYIREALDSILMQETDFPFEILLGEDESTDGTREICIEYANRYPEKVRLFLNSRKDVIYINGQPTGRANFMNNVRNAKGEYIALLPGDDYWTDPLKLQKQVGILNSNHDCSMCFHNAELFYDDNSSAPRTFNINKKPLFSVEDIICNEWFIMTSSIMFRRSWLTLPDWHLKVLNGDFVIQLMLASKGDIYYIDETMSRYRRHATGATCRFLYSSVLEHLVLILCSFNKDSNYEFNKHVIKKLDELYYNLLKAYKYEKSYGKLLLAGGNFVTNKWKLYLMKVDTNAGTY